MSNLRVLIACGVVVLGARSVRAGEVREQVGGRPFAEPVTEGAVRSLIGRVAFEEESHPSRPEARTLAEVPVVSADLVRSLVGSVAFAGEPDRGEVLALLLRSDGPSQGPLGPPQPLVSVNAEPVPCAPSADAGRSLVLAKGIARW